MQRDDELMGTRRQALLDRMGGTATAPTGGYDPGRMAALRTALGGLNPPTGTVEPIGPQPSAPGAGTWGKFPGAALDPSKVAAGHDSPKYRIDQTLRQFDPAQGFTPAVLEALNALGLGTFSSDNGQFLRVGGNVDPRFEGVLGSDMVRNFKGGGPVRWGGWGSVGAEGPGVQQAQPQGQPSMGGGMPSLGIGGLLSGDPSARIQQALSSFSQRSPNIEALLAQLAR